MLFIVHQDYQPARATSDSSAWYLSLLPDVKALRAYGRAFVELQSRFVSLYGGEHPFFVAIKGALDGRKIPFLRAFYGSLKSCLGTCLRSPTGLIYFSSILDMLRY